MEAKMEVYMFCCQCYIFKIILLKFHHYICLLLDFGI